MRQGDGGWLELNRIDSVEKVYKILRDYLGADVSETVRGWCCRLVLFCRYCLMRSLVLTQCVSLMLSTVSSV